MDGVDAAEDLHGSVLIIGFGRFGQVASQSLLARGIDVSIIDTDTEMIRAAGRLRLQGLLRRRLPARRAARRGRRRGAGRSWSASTSATPPTASSRWSRPSSRWPSSWCASFDREHALKLVEAGVDLQIRETFESALKFGEIALRELGVPEDEAAETAEDIRRRDAERFALETTGGLLAGRDLLHGNVPKPVPFTTPRRPRASAAQPADGVEKSG